MRVWKEPKYGNCPCHEYEKLARKGFTLKLWVKIPIGYICRFWSGKQRITFLKDGYVIIDSGKGTIQDAMPVTFISQEMVNRIETEMKRIGYVS